MKPSHSTTVMLFLLALVIILILPGCTSSEQLDGMSLMEQRCSVCHTTVRITEKHASLDEWTATVDRMIGKGARLDSVERLTLINYLTQTYP